MRYLAAPLALASFATACGGDPDPEPKTVTFEAARTELVAVREEGGDWRALEPAADGTATAEVTGPYAVASVCNTGGFFDYYTIYAAPDDADVFEVWCGDENATFASVTIDESQPGLVFIGFSTRTAGETAVVLPGRYDIVAIDDSTLPPRVAIQRDVQITGDTTISIDVAADGVAMNPVTISATGGGADPASSLMRLTTDDGTIARFTATENETFLVPPSLLVDGDRQVVWASSRDGLSYVGATAVVDGDETTLSLALPAGITTASLAGGAEPTVTWTSTQTFDDRYLYLSDADFSFLWDVMMFGGYVEAVGVEDSLSIPDPTAIPGWNTDWNQSNITSLDWYLSLSTYADDGSYVSASWDTALLESRRAQVRPYAAAQRAAGAAARQ